MKKILSIFLILSIAIGLMACGSTTSEVGGNETQQPTAQFKAGFGMMDITPKDPVPLGGYGDSKTRISEGLISRLDARAVVLQDIEGNLLVFAVCDISTCPTELGEQIRSELSYELNIPKQNIILSGTHTHGSVDTGLAEMPSVAAYNKQFVNNMKKAIKMAIDDLKPAQVYTGSVETEGLNFVRRYIMDDGSLIGDGARGTGTTIVSHETEVDNELQLLKFVREGGKDIMIANFQCHPHMEGKFNSVSAQVVGTFRDAVEEKMDVHCLFWQGAAGNINSKSRIESENRTLDRVKWGELLCGYAKKVYNELTPVTTGTIQVSEITFAGKVNHARDHMVKEAQDVMDYFNAGHTTTEANTYAYEKYGIATIQAASRIISNAKQPATKDIVLTAWSFGEIGGVVVPFEMFDQSGMQIKDQSPFTRTFIVGYANRNMGCYIPADYAYDAGGYEVDNSIFAKGTAEEIVAEYLKMLNEIHN